MSREIDSKDRLTHTEMSDHSSLIRNQLVRLIQFVINIIIIIFNAQLIIHYYYYYYYYYY